MLLHPMQQQLTLVPGTRQVADNLGLWGMTVNWPNDTLWTVTGIYAPVQGRALGGIRTRVVNQKGFWSFINQRDLEVLIGDAQPGEWCEWLGKRYPSPSDKEWYGFCLDELDLEDDLHTRELEIRANFPGGLLPNGLGLERNIHTEYGCDFIEAWILMWDQGSDGMTPDPRLETLMQRWRRVERRRQEWR